MDTIQAISFTIAILTAIAAIYNIRLFVKSFHADHERRKKQATIEYAAHLLRECRSSLDAKYKFQTLTEDDMNRIRNNPEEEAELRKIMGAVEHLSVGVNTGVYDKDILYRMSASYLISIFKRMKPFIEYMREEFSQNAYTELEQIATEFEESKKGRITRKTKGEIKFS